MSKSEKIKTDIVIGTRPEAIKMAPVIQELKSRGCFSVRVIATGQHTDMLTQALAFFDLRTDIDLRIMKERQSLDYITSAVLQGVGQVFDEDEPDAVLVHGDTTTTMASALAAFYRQIPVGHVEAGLRSFNMNQPFPEEMNRVVTDKIATWWFAPTQLAKDNLVANGVADDNIFITGNTVVDALYQTLKRNISPTDAAMAPLMSGRQFILLTAHRRESWGKQLENICRAVLRIVEIHDVHVLVPMHRNPAVRETISRLLGGNDRIILCDPLGYSDFVWALGHSTVILSDSGGVQEEASALAKPVIILRDVTERPEAIENGSGILAGTDENRIFEETDNLLSRKEAYAAIQKKCASAPFGDGKASIRIANILGDELSARPKNRRD
ncbi:UDP-N-acetylglucosamine 2-epimerase (non-hydrolyzing) [Synergistaceae bacterium OttesenSCG-928-I11]|nr:UDP-N-acetylglucosamine 2-epimerase (non-hydrolyzing) [Synergistaceae bacterium OttesenSCG-928-I11]